MKLLIRVLLAVTIILAGYLIAYAVINKYESNRVDERIAERKAQSAVKKKQAELTEAQKTLETRYNGLVAECQKGLTAYDRLPVLIKNQLPAPTCPATE